MSSRFVLLILLLSMKRINGEYYLNITDFDLSIRPSENFFMFVNGYWLNQTIIPSTETSYGGIHTINYEQKYKLKNILDDLIHNEKPDRFYRNNIVKQKLTDFYLAGLDEQTIERIGIEPLRKTLINLQNLRTYQDLILFILNWYKKTNKGLIFEFDVYPDERNTSVYITHWRQTGIQLPERTYYFLNDRLSKNIRMNYIQYIDRLLNLSNSILNLQTNQIDAENILLLETELANSHRYAHDLRNPQLNYNKYTVQQLHQMMPNLNWYKILSILNIKNQTILIGQPDYYCLLDKLIVSQPLNIWKNKIRYTILHEMSMYLNKDYVQARFHMFDYLIDGQRNDKVRWMKIIDEINQNLGDLLGQLFVSNYFSSYAKERTIDLIKNFILIYHQRIQRITWLTNSTKEKALKKLENIRMKIGYPSIWKTYDDVFINRSAYFQSIISIFQYNYRKKIKDLSKSVDQNEWLFPPQTVNAFYYPSFNEIIFPAAILQEPFFSSQFDDALNYGGIGYVVGHELTHALDDQGREYDENGNLNHWWTQDDINEFNSRTKILIEQFEKYQILNMNINGKLTLGENIADLCGLKVAFQAFQQTKQAKEGILIDGLTPQQRFFIAAARAWRVKLTDEKLVSELKNDPHAPAMLRVNGPLSNMIEFYQTYNVTSADGMYREPNDRVMIW